MYLVVALIIALGMFLREQFITDFGGDFRTDALSGPAGHDLVQPKPRIVADRREQRLGILAGLHPRAEFRYWEGLRDDEADEDAVIGVSPGNDVDDEPHTLDRCCRDLYVGHLAQLGIETGFELRERSAVAGQTKQNDYVYTRGALAPCGQ